MNNLIHMDDLELMITDNVCLEVIASRIGVKEHSVVRALERKRPDLLKKLKRYPLPDRDRGSWR